MNTIISDQTRGTVQLDLNFDQVLERDEGVAFASIPHVEAANRARLVLVHSTEVLKPDHESTTRLSSHQVTAWIKQQALRLGW